MILKNVMNSIFKATYIRGFYLSVVNLWLAKSIVDSDCKFKTCWKLTSVSFYKHQNTCKHFLTI